MEHFGYWNKILHVNLADRTHLDRGAGRRLLPALRRRARPHRALPPQVRPQGRRSPRPRQHPGLRAGRRHRRARARAPAATAWAPSRRSPAVRRVGVGRLLGRRAEARGLGRHRLPRRLADARLSLDQRRRGRVPRRRATSGEASPATSRRRSSRSWATRASGGPDRPGRREPRALRLHRQRPERGGGPHGHGRGDGQQAPQGHRGARQDPREDRRPEGADRHRQVGVLHHGRRTTAPSTSSARARPCRARTSRAACPRSTIASAPSTRSPRSTPSRCATRCA